MAASDINNNTAILIQPVKLHYRVSARTKYNRMKWVCVLSLLFILYTHIVIWALARSHPHGPLYRPGLDRGEGVMDNFDISSEASSRIKRSSRRILEDQHSENEDGSEIVEEYVKSDYGISDPPPVTGWPTKKPVQYRIFNRPPAPSPHP